MTAIASGDRIAYGTIAYILCAQSWNSIELVGTSCPVRATVIAPRHPGGAGKLRRTNTIMKRSHKAECVFSILAVAGTGFGKTPPKAASVPEPKAKSELV